ncbi:MAG TPA: DUF3048 domain-containing protein [Patescibacteria group bacterium]|nr:DUF3048 domain-containing protein [Patescibacteria group bacterium]
MAKISKQYLITLVMSFLGLYLISAGVSYAVFSYIGKDTTPVAQSDLPKDARVDLSQPKTEECVMNGKYYTKDEKNIWETRRPIAAMIENHLDARPLSGISKADIIYEAVAEGGITRMLNIFYCGAAAEDVEIAPVRSARIYFVNWAQEYEDPIFMHVGGANDYAGYGDTAKDARALEYLTTIGWRVAGGNDFDTTFDSGYPVFWRNYERLDHEVATEHTMTASLDEAYKQAEKRGFGPVNEDGEKWSDNFVAWRFVDDKVVETPEYETISFDFWDNKPDYSVSWKYDKSKNAYLRSNGGKEFIDLTTGSQLEAKNVVIQFVKERGPVDRNIHMLYTTTGEGKATFFNQGTVTEGTWEKITADSRTRFYDDKGKEVSFVRGLIWIEAIPTGNVINY